MKQFFSRPSPAVVGMVIFVVWFFWVAYILISTNIDVRQVASLGVFGDSFGVLNSLFASLALIFTVLTNQMQSKQLGELSKDRHMQYYKQLYDLYFLDEKVSSAYYYFEHGLIRFFPKPLLDGKTDYWIIERLAMTSITLESSIDALLSVADLTVKYIDEGLIDSKEHFEYRLINIVSNVHIVSYLKTLDEYNALNSVKVKPFPNLYKYIALRER